MFFEIHRFQIFQKGNELSLVFGDGNERDEPVLERIPYSVGSRFRPGSFNRVR